MLPNSLAQTLQYLSDDDLKALRVNVETELERRRTNSAGPIASKASVPQATATAQASRQKVVVLDD